jgi:hypothetical protein
MYCNERARQGRARQCNVVYICVHMCVCIAAPQKNDRTLDTKKCEVDLTGILETPFYLLGVTY